MAREKSRSIGQLNADLAEAKVDALLAAYLGKGAAELTTGRATLYHGTSKARARSINENGFVPGARFGIRDTLAPDKAGPPAVYFTRNPKMAQVYGKQTRGLERAGQQAAQTGGGIFEQRDAMHNWANNPSHRVADTVGSLSSVLKAKVPTWKFPTIENPEVDSSGAMARQLRNAIPAASDLPRNSVVSQLLDKWLGQRVRKELKSNVVIPEHVPAEYIVGHPSYKGLSLGEVGEYAKARPGRFGRGIGAAVGAGLSAYDLIQALRGKGIAAKLGGRDEG